MIRLHDGYNLQGLMEEHHVDKAGFVADAKDEHGVSILVDDVRHLYGRWVPSRMDDGQPAMEFHWTRTPGRGAFACTYWSK